MHNLPWKSVDKQRTKSPDCGSLTFHPGKNGSPKAPNRASVLFAAL